jgi:hypothetical protein
MTPEQAIQNIKFAAGHESLKLSLKEHAAIQESILELEKLLPKKEEKNEPKK